MAAVRWWTLIVLQLKRRRPSCWSSKSLGREQKPMHFFVTGCGVFGQTTSGESLRPAGHRQKCKRQWGPTASYSQFCNASIDFFVVKTVKMVKKPRKCCKDAWFQARAAYRNISLQWHPDKNPGSGAEFYEVGWILHPGFGMRCGKECEDKMSEITKAFMLCGCMEVEKAIAKLKSLRFRSQNL